MPAISVTYISQQLVAQYLSNSAAVSQVRRYCARAEKYLARVLGPAPLVFGKTYSTARNLPCRNVTIQTCNISAVTDTYTCIRKLTIQ